MGDVRLVHSGSCAIFTVEISLTGFLFGKAAALALDEIKHYEHWMLAGVAVVVLVSYIIKRIERYRIERLREIT